jgi:hypothetical protein
VNSHCQRDDIIPTPVTNALEQRSQLCPEKKRIVSERSLLAWRSIITMPNTELIAEIEAAAQTLGSAADLVRAGDLRAAEVKISDAQFRMRSILIRVDLPEGHQPSLLRPRI